MMAPLTRPGNDNSVETTYPFIWRIESLWKYELLVEYTSLQSLGQCPDGIYLIPNRDQLGVFIGSLFIREGTAFKGVKLNFDLDYTAAYPHDIPMVWLRRNKNPLSHPLVDADQCLHIGRLIRERAPDGTITIASVLRAIKAAFSDKTLRKMDAESCINYAVKHQIDSDFDNYIRLVQAEYHR